jgi:argininosuccinate lyase
MLWKQGIITREDIETLLRGLTEVETLYGKGTFTVDPSKEDVHSTVESYLIEHYGMESAGRLHTGRSRNDQIVLDLRLYMRAEVLDFVMLLVSLIDTVTQVARNNLDTIMPGYTHHQPGMIGSWGHLLFSYAVALERDVRRFVSWYGLFNYNPLGGAAGYGTRLPLDRKLTAQLMGFDGIHESSLDPAHNRWEPEAELGYGISIMMNHLSNLAQTLILLSTSEFGMVRLEDAYCTGSSLMPQKRNPDPLEVIKGKAAFAQGMVVALLTLGRSLFAGYNRESQWSKYPLMDVVDECKPSLAVMRELIASLTFNREAALTYCKKAFIAATDVVE